MNKILFSAVVAGIIAATAATTEAQESGRYVRKTVRPEFFIPERELQSRQEQLPQFPAIESGMIKAIDGKVMIRTEETQPIEHTPTQQAQNPSVAEKNIFFEYQIKPHHQPAAEPVEIEPPAPKAAYKPEDGLGNGLSQDEAYQRKEKAYENDLKTMAQTGVMPENEELNADLEKMKSSISFKVE